MRRGRRGFQNGTTASKRKNRFPRGQVVVSDFSRAKSGPFLAQNFWPRFWSRKKTFFREQKKGALHFLPKLANLRFLGFWTPRCPKRRGGRFRAVGPSQEAPCDRGDENSVKVSVAEALGPDRRENLVSRRKRRKSPVPVFSRDLDRAWSGGPARSGEGSRPPPPWAGPPASRSTLQT